MGVEPAVAPESVELPARFGEHAPHHRLEVRQGERVVARVEGALIPTLAKVHARPVVGMMPMAVPGVAIPALVVEVVVALEQAVMPHCGHAGSHVATVRSKLRFLLSMWQE